MRRSLYSWLSESRSDGCSSALESISGGVQTEYMKEESIDILFLRLFQSIIFQIERLKMIGMTMIRANITIMCAQNSEYYNKLYDLIRFRFEEDWDYFKSFYFFFCSLTTIGYGKYLIFVFEVVMVRHICSVSEYCAKCFDFAPYPEDIQRNQGSKKLIGVLRLLLWPGLLYTIAATHCAD